MTRSKFKALKIGDQVTLAEARPDYTCGHPTLDGKVYIPAGTVGTVGAVKVPTVTGNKGRFICIDFPNGTPLFDYKGRSVEHWDRKNGFRCSAFPEELV